MSPSAYMVVCVYFQAGTLLFFGLALCFYQPPMDEEDLADLEELERESIEGHLGPGDAYESPSVSTCYSFKWCKRGNYDVHNGKLTCVLTAFMLHITMSNKLKNLLRNWSLE